jgi:SAM-dependent methyltransferase
MTEPSLDSWAAGDAYEAYMGRWSGDLARTFLDWLRPEPPGHWLEVGCGTGALTAAICARCRPASVVACDPSQAFIDHARRHVAGPCTFQIIADALPRREGHFDAVVSGLVLNFIPAPGPALAAMRERVRPGGIVAAYIWDYAGGAEFLRIFWEEAVALDPGAASLDEAERFRLWQRPVLASLFGEAGLARIQTDVLEMVTDFADFEDYWKPFLGASDLRPAT